MTPGEIALARIPLRAYSVANDLVAAAKPPLVRTEDAIFQGLHPYSVGRRGVFDYYESQPVGLTVTYRINETRRPAEGVVLGYLRADFTRPVCTGVPLNLSVLVTRGTDGWRIAHHQVSAVPS
jgi:hypothetical protein